MTAATHISVRFSTSWVNWSSDYQYTYPPPLCIGKGWIFLKSGFFFSCLFKMKIQRRRGCGTFCHLKVRERTRYFSLPLLLSPPCEIRKKPEEHSWALEIFFFFQNGKQPLHSQIDSGWDVGWSYTGTAAGKAWECSQNLMFICERTCACFLPGKARRKKDYLSPDSWVWGKICNTDSHFYYLLKQEALFTGDQGFFEKGPGLWFPSGPKRF